MLIFRWERRVEAVCPEAFSAEAEVPVCPTVPSRTKPQLGQMWVRTLKLFLTRVPHAEQSALVHLGATAITAIRRSHFIPRMNDGAFVRS